MLGLGSSSQLGIGIAVYLQDKFSGKAAQINQQLLAMRKNANGAVVGAMRDYRNNAAMVAGGAAAVGLGMYKMAEAGAEFQHRINMVAIVGGSQLKRTREDLSKFAQEMSKTFSKSPTEIAAAMFENVKAGVTDNIEEITRYQIAVATATDEQLDGAQGVAEKLLGIMAAYDLPISRFKDIANATTSVANATISNVRDIGEAMQYAAFTAKSFNIPLEMTLAMIGKLSQAKIFGSSAGTAINNMLLQLSKTLGPSASKKSQKLWAMMGVDQDNMRAMANKGDMAGVIKTISEATRNMDPITKQGILGDLFNRRGMRGLMGLFDSKNGNVDIAKLSKGAMSDEKNDIALRQSKAMMNDLSGEMKLLTNAFHRFKIAFMTSAAPTLRVLLNILSKVLNVFGAIINNPIGKVFIGMAMIGAGVIAMLFAFRAAVLTAQIALLGFARGSAVGGFSNLAGAGMGMMGMGRFGAAGGAFTRNAAGRMMVKGGQTLNFGGKLYKGGQILPQAFAQSMGMSAMGGTAGMGARTMAFFGKAGPWLGRIAGFGAKWLPVVGWIWTAVELLRFIAQKDRDPDDEKNFKKDPLVLEYYRSLDLQQGYGRSTVDDYNSMGTSRTAYNKKTPFTQNINLYVDGQHSMNQVVNQNLEDELNKTLEFNLSN